MEKETEQEVARNISRFTEIFTDPIKQRMSHPIVGSFAISFTFVNWKPILFLIFSPKGMEDKIDFITKNFYETGLRDVWFYVILPLTLSLIYVVVLKWVDWVVDNFISFPKKGRSKIKADERIEQIHQNIRVINKQKEEDKAKAENKELSELNNQIEDLKKDLDYKETLITGLNDEKIALQAKITEMVNQMAVISNDYTELIGEKSLVLSRYDNFKEASAIAFKIFRASVRENAIDSFLRKFDIYSKNRDAYDEFRPFLYESINSDRTRMEFTIPTAFSNEILRRVESTYGNFLTLKIFVTKNNNTESNLVVQYFDFESELDIRENIKQIILDEAF